MVDSEKSIPKAMSAGQPNGHPQGKPVSSREERLAAALRDNLRRRKEQKSAKKPAQD